MVYNPELEENFSAFKGGESIMRRLIEQSDFHVPGEDGNIFPDHGEAAKPKHIDPSKSGSAVLSLIN